MPTRPRLLGSGAALALALLTVAGLIGACSAAPEQTAFASDGGVVTGRAGTSAAALGDLYFEPNRGQAQADVAYVGRGHGLQVFAAPTRLGLSFARSPVADEPLGIAGLRLSFSGASGAPHISGMGPQSARTHYLAGSVAPRAILDVPRFDRIRYAGLYPGIDLVIYERNRSLEYDFAIAPGADPAAVRIQFGGADGLRLRADGSLAFEVAGRTMRQPAPEIYQRDGDDRRAVDGGYWLRGDELSFWVGDYDPTLALVIDPVLAFSTYLTGNGADAAHAISVDVNNGNQIYVAGRILSNKDFPITEGSYKDTQGSPFFQYVVTKLAPAGDKILFSTYFPAPIADIEEAGLTGVYITGKGCEFNFDPDAKRDLTKCGIFVAQLNAAGTALTATKVLSGPGLSDNFNSIGGMTVGGLGDVYVTGTLVTGTLPTTAGAAQATSAGSSDAFVVRFDFGAYGVTVKFATYLGGSDSDGAAGIARQQAFVPRSDGFKTEHILAVAGWTSSADFPVTAGAFQTTRGGSRDAFVATLDPWTGKLIAATYLGGSSREFTGTEFGNLKGGIVDVSLSGKIYVVGSTESPNFPLDEPLPNLSPSVSGRVNDAFVTTFWPDLDATYKSTRLGGTGAESDVHVRVHNTEEIAYVLGNTRSTDFPTKDPVQATYGGGTSVNGDLFVAKLQLGRLAFATYLGGAKFDDGNDIDVDLDDNIYVTGSTGGGFPLKSPIQPTPGGSASWFVAKISPAAAPPLPANAQLKASVTGWSYDRTLGHNIPNLNVEGVAATVRTANFLDFYNRTGGVERWGLPTSEVFEEAKDTLTQYYQRGVVDWKPAPGGGAHTLQRRLAWDFIGGGLGGSTDQGVEPGLTSTRSGTALGPWGHKVSNLAVDGTQVKFKEFFDRLGGKDSFGFPKTDARPDTHAKAVLHTSGTAKDGRIRQYFQAAVLEYHPDSFRDKVKIGLIGDTLRNQKYLNNAWQQIKAFQVTSSVYSGQDVLAK